MARTNNTHTQQHENTQNTKEQQTFRKKHIFCVFPPIYIHKSWIVNNVSVLIFYSPDTLTRNTGYNYSSTDSVQWLWPSGLRLEPGSVWGRIPLRDHVSCHVQQVSWVSMINIIIYLTAYLTNIPLFMLNYSGSKLKILKTICLLGERGFYVHPSSGKPSLTLRVYLIHN